MRSRRYLLQVGAQARGAVAQLVGARLQALGALGGGEQLRAARLERRLGVAPRVARARDELRTALRAKTN